MTDAPNPATRRRIDTRPPDEATLLDMHELDMAAKFDDPHSVPRAPTGVEEGVTERGGRGMVDLQAMTPDLDRLLIEVDERLTLDEPALDQMPEEDTLPDL